LKLYLYSATWGGRGQIIDDQVLAAQEALKEAIKKGFSIINGSFCCKPGFIPVCGHVSHFPIAAKILKKIFKVFFKLPIVIT
jgi:hypothetical protein